MEASGLLNWGGVTAVAAVAVAKWRPVRSRGSRVLREPIDLTEVRLLCEEVAMDGGTRGDRPMAMTNEMPASVHMDRAPGAPTGAPSGNAAPTGLPSEQLYTWLEWVQDDLRRVETRIEYLEAARSQLREQERLLSELLRTAGPVSRT